MRPLVVRVAPLHHGWLVLDCRLLLALLSHQHQSMLGAGSMQLNGRGTDDLRLPALLQPLFAVMHGRTG